MPLHRFEHLLGFEADGIVVPIACDVDVNFALFEVDSKALPLESIEHARHYAAIRHTIRVNPSRQRELIIDIEIRHRSAVEKSFTVEGGGPADSSRSERNCSILRLGLLIGFKPDEAFKSSRWSPIGRLARGHLAL